MVSCNYYAISYFEVLVDHKAIEYMIKSKTQSATTRLKTLLLKLSEYTIDLKYQKGSEMHTSDTLSRFQNITDTPDNYIKHAYSHLVQNLYVHKTKLLDTTQVKRKHCRPPKAKLAFDVTSSSIAVVPIPESVMDSVLGS